MRYERKEQFEKVNAFGTGTANTAYAQYFTGDSFLNPLTDPEGGLFAANVTFEPGCRNNWHIHHADKGGGQLLLCTAGEGWYQEEGKAAVSLHEGSVVAESCSGGLSPTLSQGIGMAYLPAALGKPGLALEIEIRGRRFAAETVKKPFYRKPQA